MFFFPSREHEAVQGPGTLAATNGCEREMTALRKNKDSEFQGKGDGEERQNEDKQ
jgi:hypothetical protein